MGEVEKGREVENVESRVEKVECGEVPRAQVEPCGSLAVTEGKKDYVIMSTKSYRCHFIFINSKLSYCVQKILIISAFQLYSNDSSIFPLSPSHQLRELIPPSPRQ